VKKIVKGVLAELDNTLLSITQFPVGLESRVKEVIMFIENQSNKGCKIGIWGMGGLGKTTTAKAIYNQIRRKYVHRSFIESIRQVCEQESKGYIHLQEQLLLDVLKTEMKVNSTAAGTTLIEERLRGKSTLLVLDDVTKFEQVHALCGNRKWISSGSVFMVTSRDIRLLHLLEVDYIYKVEEMNENESLELFSWHAFREVTPTQDFIELSRNVVSYCGGLPLALEVLGSYLHKRTKQDWKSVLSKLRIIPNDHVQEKLRISFDGLQDEMERDIFLDICCFFIGKERGYVTEILNSCGLHADIGITVLIERSLVRIEENNKLGMHDLVRDMGREIIRHSSPKDPGKRSRLWFHEDVLDVLTNNTVRTFSINTFETFLERVFLSFHKNVVLHFLVNKQKWFTFFCAYSFQGRDTIEGLALKLHGTGRDCFEASAFKEMKRLKLLKLDSVQLTGSFAHLSKQLRWICWRGFPLKYIPVNFYQRSVVAINLKHSNLKLVWKETQVYILNANNYYLLPLTTTVHFPFSFSNFCMKIFVFCSCWSA